jgi:N-acetylmuramoyl-L-alanine amidase
MNTLTDIDKAITSQMLEQDIQNEFLPSPNFNSRPAIPIDTLVIHFTALELQPSIRHLCSPVKQVSTHFIIARDGALFQLVSVGERAWHVGVSSLYGQADVNSFSVGIDLVFVPKQLDEYTDPQYDVLSRLTRSLITHLPIVNNRIIGHEHVALPAGRKNDPGPRFDWKRYFFDAGLGSPPPLVRDFVRG